MAFLKHIPKRHVDEGDNRVLSHLEYQEPAPVTTQGQVKADIPLETTLDSVTLGGLHTISSGGRQFWIQNKEYAIDYHAALGGVPSPDGMGSGGLPIPGYLRVYEDSVRIYTEDAGDVDYTSSINFEDEITLTENNGFEAMSFIPVEEFTGTLCFEIFYSPGVNHTTSILKYTKVFKVDPDPTLGEEPPLQADVEYIWWSKTPLDLKEAETVYFYIKTECDQFLQVRPRLLEAVPWKRIWARQFIEPSINIGFEWVEEDRVVYESANFIVGTGAYTFTVSPTTTNFTISDGDSQFNMNNQIVDIGGVLYVLNRKDQKYVFIKTPLGWKYYIHPFKEL